MKKIILCTVLLLLTVLFLISCGRHDEPYTASMMGPFDTVTVLSGYTDGKREFERFSERFESLLWEYHRLYDIYTDYPGLNNLKTVNDMAGIAPVSVDARIIALLKYALPVDEMTGGACRVTYGAVLRIWHEHRTEGVSKPTAAALTEAAKHTDPSLLVIDEAAGTVFLRDPLASLDVGAIAKGYAVEEVCKQLLEEGFSSFAANVGGNLRTVGNMKNGKAWELGIRDPMGNGVLLYLPASNSALVTSGIYERYYEVNGEHLHHIIDPHTNAPAQTWASISVLAPDSALADALSTALFCMTAEEGAALIASLPEVEALWIDTSGEITASPGLSVLLEGRDSK